MDYSADGEMPLVLSTEACGYKSRSINYLQWIIYKAAGTHDVAVTTVVVLYPKENMNCSCITISSGNIISDMLNLSQ